jgi:hypothetical protein
MLALIAKADIQKVADRGDPIFKRGSGLHHIRDARANQFVHPFQHVPPPSRHIVPQLAQLADQAKYISEVF